MLLALTACPASGDAGDAQPSTDSSSGGVDDSATVDPTDATAWTEADSSGGQTDAAADSSTGDPIACPASTARPSPRSELDGVWDAPRDRMVFFGGDQGFPVSCMSQTDFLGETWAFRPDCDAFELLTDKSGAGPGPRGRYALAHDVAGQRMIVHGGRFRAGTSGTYTLYDDTWVLDLTTDTWTEITATGPSARTNHTAVVAGDRMLVFGGNTSTDGLAFAPQNDLWALDLQTQTWQALTTNGPSPRLFHAATVTADGTTMFVYGGGNETAFTGPFFADLWAYDVAGDTWVMMDAGASGPVGSIWGDLVFDPSGSRLLLWGAHEDNLLGNNNKLWSYALAGRSWQLHEEGDVLQNNAAGFCDFPADFVAADLQAPERRSAGAAVLTGDGELLVFGGKTDCGIADDVWSWSTADEAWRERVPATAGEICVRAFAEGCDTMCF